ncbi:hypothetical protein A6302_03906 [Methylobrevis pamukkalensis]|uniref:Uncharacterized protein n=1 Tax=Methylobrevis pamukkalensis TaxID=1439726 RepID=A0A1E3GY09_9HYPH|nr:hypothetical protein A6302_03906 [Methylobrevis pamukkalensis]
MLDTLKDTCRHLRLVALRRAVDHPDVGATGAQVGPHLLETLPVEEARHGDEADDALLIAVGPTGGVAPAGAKHLEARPAPEVDVEILQMLGMGADMPLGRGPPPFHRRRSAIRAMLDPAAKAVRLFLVGRVADHDSDLLVALDRIGRAPRLRHRLHHRRDVFFLGEGIAERVGDEQLRHGKIAEGAGVLHQFGIFGEQAKLGHREGPELQLEADQALGCTLQRAGYAARPEIVARRLRDLAQHAEKKGAGAHRRVGNGHVRRREPGGPSEQRPAQGVVHQPHHGGHDLRRRVVGAGLLAQPVVVDSRKCS